MVPFCGTRADRSFPKSRTLRLDKRFGKVELRCMNLADARKEKGWSQEELARRLGLKSKGYICEIEGGETPSLRVAVGLWRELGVKVAPIADLTDHEIGILEKTQRAA
jgi:ribosome-binding protein aMBF1 (putative translation factor)